MKRLFSFTKVPKSTASAAQPTPEAAIPVTTIPPLHHTGLQPKDTLPPVPHPCPYEHISLLATSNGLLLRPRHPGRPQDESESEVKIEWGKGGKVHSLTSNDVDAPWEEGAVVYGLVGILELYSGNYLLSCPSYIPIIVSGQRLTF